MFLVISYACISADELTEENFAPHTEVFEDYKCEIIPAKDEKGSPSLGVKNKKKQINITPFSNIVTIGKKGQDDVGLCFLFQSRQGLVGKGAYFFTPKSNYDKFGPEWSERYTLSLNQTGSPKFGIITQTTKRLWGDDGSVPY